MTSAKFATFWHGNRPTNYELLCWTSFGFYGAELTVFTYEDSLIPTGNWKIGDASKILSKNELFENTRNPGSFAGFSNLFRYHLLLNGEFIWVDSDILLLRKPDRLPKWLYASEETMFINGAVLGFPPASGIPEKLIEAASKVDKNSFLWGELGPRLLTKTLVKSGKLTCKAPSQMIYPLPASDIWKIFDPNHKSEVQDNLKKATFLHLWNEMFRNFKTLKISQPPNGSYAAEQFEQLMKGITLDWPVNFPCEDFNRMVLLSQSKTRIRRILEAWSPRFLRAMRK